VAHIPNNVADRSINKSTKTKNNTRIVARVYSPYYATRDDAPWAPAPEGIMIRADNTRFIEAENEVKSVARIRATIFGWRQAEDDASARALKVLYWVIRSCSC
jgi:hypothetical protein